MKVIYGIGKVPKKIQNAVLAMGVFDGLHLGHQQLIRRAIKQAKAINGQTLVMTFHPHPVHVLRPDAALPLIVSLSHRLKLIEDMGVAKCIVINFTKQFAKLSPQKFIKRYFVDHICPKEIFVGEDFRFGKDRGGGLNCFKMIGQKYGFKVNDVKHVNLKESRGKIGSTLIRQLIIDGKLKQAEKLLGRKISVMGKVVKGDSRGKILGFPTANILPENEVVLPLGVYAVKVLLKKKWYHGMANVGQRPSFQPSSNAVHTEVHIFDFNRNIYGQNIFMEFTKKIRSEKIFPTQESLISQLKRDEHKARSIFTLSRSS